MYYRKWTSGKVYSAAGMARELATVEPFDADDLLRSVEQPGFVLRDNWELVEALEFRCPTCGGTYFGTVDLESGTVECHCEGCRWVGQRSECGLTLAD